MGRPTGAVSTLARLVGKDRTTYIAWQEEGLVAGPRGDEPTELDAIEVGALACLLDELGDEDGRIAWNQVRASLLAGIPSVNLRLVWHDEAWEAELCQDDPALTRAVTSDNRPLCVIAVGQAAGRKRAALQRRAHGLARRATKKMGARESASQAPA